MTLQRSMAYFSCPGVEMSKHAEMFFFSFFFNWGLLVTIMALIFYILTLLISFDSVGSRAKCGRSSQVRSKHVQSQCPIALAYIKFTRVNCRAAHPPYSKKEQMKFHTLDLNFGWRWQTSPSGWNWPVDGHWKWLSIQKNLFFTAYLIFKNKNRLLSLREAVLCKVNSIQVCEIVLKTKCLIKSKCLKAEPF